MSCKFTVRNLCCRKNYACFLSIVVLCTVAWLRLVEFDGGYMPLRPLLDAESEARRLLAFMTHYNYQCNSTAGQIGNWTMWPVCVDRDAGLSLDTKDAKLMYTIGSPSDFNLERTLALNHTFEVNVVTPQPVARSLNYINNTYVIRTTIVANDPADFSRNSFAQRTLNDLLAVQGHSAARIHLLRLVGTDSDIVSMSDVVHFLVADGVLKHVQQLHLSVYIDKLDEDYLYGWYRTLYRLFSSAGFHLYHTSSHDSLCLQVTLMQSCVYFLAYVRNPGVRAQTMQPPADYGTVREEWSRLQEYINTVQLNCRRSTNVVFSSADTRSIDDVSDLSCSENQPTMPVGSCLTAVFSFSRNVKQMMSSAKRCSVLSLVPVTDAGPDLSITEFKLTRTTDDPGSVGHTESVTRDEAVDDWRRSDGPTSVIINVPRVEFDIVNLLLSNDLLQNVTQLLMYVELPDVNSKTHPIILRGAYSTLRRVAATGLSLFLVQPIPSSRHSSLRPQSDHNVFYRYNDGNSEKAHRRYWLGFSRANFR